MSLGILVGKLGSEVSLSSVCMRSVLVSAKSRMLVGRITLGNAGVIVGVTGVICWGLANSSPGSLVILALQSIFLRFFGRW